MLILSTLLYMTLGLSSLSRRKDANSQQLESWEAWLIKSIKKEGC